MPFERSFPPVLGALHALDLRACDDATVDFVPFKSFMSEEDTNRLLRTRTHNDAPGGTPFRVFGACSQGGHAAFWLVRPATPVLGQPVVYFAATPKAGVVARSFSDYLWLLAGGVGPAEAILDLPPRAGGNRIFAAFAKKHALGGKKSRREILAAAHARFPSFGRDLLATCH